MLELVYPVLRAGVLPIDRADFRVLPFTRSRHDSPTLASHPPSSLRTIDLPPFPIHPPIPLPIHTPTLRLHLLHLLLLFHVLIARRRDGKGERPCKLTFKSATCYLSRYSSAYDFFFFSFFHCLLFCLYR